MNFSFASLLNYPRPVIEIAGDALADCPTKVSHDSLHVTFATKEPAINVYTQGGSFNPQ